MASIVIGDYTYNTSGSVYVVDQTKQSYGSILSSFEYDGQTYDVTDMSNCFYKCVNLINAPTIPEGIINMTGCFGECVSLIETPTIPTSVENLSRCFLRCTSLTYAKDFPLTTTPVLKDMSDCFAYCTSLTKAPKQIPKSVTTLEGCFMGCKSLKRSVQSIYSIVSSGTDPLNMAGCFAGCESLETAPALPDKVTDLELCFQGCISLTNVSRLPKNVIDVSNCFDGCQSLQGNIEVENVPEDSAGIFANTYNQNIYIINKASSEETKEKVAKEWKSIASRYSSVHYEADDHSAPTIVLSAKRSNNDGESSSTGRYITVTKQYNYSLDNLPVGWDVTLTESMELDGESITPTSSEPGESITFTIPQEINELSHTIVYKVNDHYKTTVQTVEISKVMALLDFFGNPSNKVYPGDKSGMGMAIGNIAKRNGLDIQFPTTIGEGLLPATNFKDYDVVENPTGNPKEQRYYELIDDIYVETEDIEVDSTKTYYKGKDETEYVDLNNYQLVAGKYNKQNNKATFIIGNGTDENNPSNLMEVGKTITIGNSDNESYMYLDYHSLQLIDKEGNTYFHVSDLRDKNGEAEIVETLYGDGTKVRFSLSFRATDTDYSVTVNGREATNITKEDLHVIFTTAPSTGDVIVFTYNTKSTSAKALTFGKRKSGIIGGVSTALGRNVLASGFNSYAEGYNTTASGSYSHAEGLGAEASGYGSHAEGYITKASGPYSHAEGLGAEASGWCSHAEGERTTASDNSSHAEGERTIANEACSHAEGDSTVASGWASHAEGYGSIASGYQSHAQNCETIAAGQYQTAIGRFNIEDTERVEDYQKAFIIGNGTGDDDRSNAFTVDWDGNITSWSKDFERDTVGILNDGFKIADRNGDVIAYMKGLYTVKSSGHTVEGLNIGTSRVVDDSTIWNTLRLMIDADGSPVVTINQVDAWLKALGLYEPTTPTISLTNITTGSLDTIRGNLYGKQMHLVLSFKNRAAIAPGSNIFVGTISQTKYRPKDFATGVGYYGGAAVIVQIQAGGNITARVIGATIPANNIVWANVSFLIP